jgi:murein DD-endopeptidase MepM/ murein hydrolase activator NlpD
MRSVFGRALALAFVLLLCAGMVRLVPAAAQGLSCGVVDSLDYPLNISDTISRRYDDFGLYRQRFGGRHTGLDVAFNRHYEPVYASARGRVTYSNPEGWDTEKGVVIVQHLFPDGSTYYTLYGHMEQTDEITFPPVGTCVERGDVVGVVGWPSRGAPHLHYEIRNFLPNDGGPGYVTENPLLDGWLDPLDFTELWRLRFAGGFVRAYSFTDVPSLPPLVLSDNTTVIANGSAIESFTADGRLAWRVSTDGEVNALVPVAGGVLAHTRSGQAMVLRGGRYAALWSAPGADAPVVVLGENTVIFVTNDGGLNAYDLAGASRWSLPGSAAFSRVVDFQNGGQDAALLVRAGESTRLRVVSAAGQTSFETTFDSAAPLLAPVPGGGWLVLDGAALWRVHDDSKSLVTRLDAAPGRTANLTADALGNAYLYLGDWDSTLLSINRGGQVRWRTTYPAALAVIGPLLRADNGCLLYGLDDDGAFHVFDASSGELSAERQIYAGGIRNSSPAARFLRPQADNTVVVGAGFLTTVVLDGAALGGGVLDRCILG